MNVRISTATRKEGGVANERIHPRVEQVPMVGLEEENEEVSLQETQVPLESQELKVPQMPPMPQAPFVEGDMTNA